jgi:hypothetical protein
VEFVVLLLIAFYDCGCPLHETVVSLQDSLFEEDC